MKWIRLLAVMLCLAPGPALAAGNIPFGRYHAVVIGNNDYANLPDLTTASGDARAVAKLLEDAYGFETKLLIDASRNQVINTLAKLRGKLTPNDNLLVYYAGHGVLDSYSDEGYWLPVDADEDTPANWVSNADVTNMLRAIRARHVMVIADSCYSGTLVRAAPVRIPTAIKRDEWVQRMAAKRSRTALVSGGLEPVSDVGGGRHSIFAKAFLQALDENQAVMDGHSLFTAIKRPVALEAEQTPRYADIRRAGHDGGDFLFVRRFGVATSTAPPLPPLKPPPADGALDLAFWDSIKSSSDRADFEAYLKRFPDGVFSDLARNRLKALEDRRLVSLRPPAETAPRPQSCPECAARLARLAPLLQGGFRIENAGDLQPLLIRASGRVVEKSGRLSILVADTRIAINEKLRSSYPVKYFNLAVVSYRPATSNDTRRSAFRKYRRLEIGRSRDIPIGRTLKAGFDYVFKDLDVELDIRDLDPELVRSAIANKGVFVLLSAHMSEGSYVAAQAGVGHQGSENQVIGGTDP